MDKEIHGESNVWSTAQRSTDLMFTVDLSETIDQLTMANCVRWYRHVLRREDGHVLRRALDFEVNGQSTTWRLKRRLNKQVEEESVTKCLRREDERFRTKWCVGAKQIAAGLM